MANSPTKRDPKYRRQRRPHSADQAFVQLDGERIYLGTYGSPESKTEYHRLLKEWESNGRCLPVSSEEITVNELILRFYRYAQELSFLQTSSGQG